MAHPAQDSAGVRAAIGAQESNSLPALHVNPSCRLATRRGVASGDDVPAFANLSAKAGAGGLDRQGLAGPAHFAAGFRAQRNPLAGCGKIAIDIIGTCLLYTSDAAEERS